MVINPLSFLRSLFEKISGMPRWIVLAGGVVVLVAVGGGGWMWWTGRQGPSFSVPREEIPPKAPSPQELAMKHLQEKAISGRSEDRKAAVAASKEMKDAAAAFKLLSPLLSDPDVQVREQAVKRLGEVLHPDAKKGLSKALNDKDVYVAVYAAESLAKQGDFSGKDMAIRMIKEMDDPLIRVSALKTLELSKDLKVRSLVKRLLWAKDPAVQQAAKSALDSLDLKEKEDAAKDRMMKEADKKKLEAQKALASSLSYYRKRMVQEPSFSGNHAVAVLQDIFKKYKESGADLSEVEKELIVQEKIRKSRAATTPPKKMAPTGSTLKAGVAVSPSSVKQAPTGLSLKAGKTPPVISRKNPPLARVTLKEPPAEPIIRFTLQAVQPTTQAINPTSSSMQTTLPHK